MISLQPTEDKAETARINSALQELTGIILDIYSEILEISLDDGSYCSLLDNGTAKKQGNVYIDFMLTAEKYVYPEDKQDFLEFFDERNIKRAIDEGNNVMKLDFRRRSDSGDYEWVHARNIFPDNSAETMKYYICFRDTDESRREELEENRRLREEVAAEKLENQMLTQLLEQLSHGIRTPLNDVTGLVSLARQQVGGSGVMTEYLDRIAGASKQITLLLGLLGTTSEREGLDGKYRKNSKTDTSGLQAGTANGLFNMEMPLTKLIEDDITVYKSSRVEIPSVQADDGGLPSDSRAEIGSEETIEPSAPDTDTTWMEGRRVLLVEDNELNLEITKSILEISGAKVDTVTDGKQAVIRFIREPAGYYDVILMDIQMPVLDGHEATRCIRISGKDDAKSIPIFALSAGAYEEDREKSRLSGMNEHIVKPIEFRYLYRKLREYIEESKINTKESKI